MRRRVIAIVVIYLVLEFSRRYLMFADCLDTLPKDADRPPCEIGEQCFDRAFKRIVRTGDRNVSVVSLRCHGSVMELLWRPSLHRILTGDSAHFFLPICSTSLIITAMQYGGRGGASSACGCCLIS